MSVNNIKGIQRQKPLNIMIYENIKTAIINKEIKGGTHLTEKKISEQMSVSTTPVREAFRRLESEGLVTIEPWRGAIVRELNEQHIIEVYQCREALEVLAIQLATDNVDEADIKSLEDLLEESAQSEDNTEYTKINTKIHELFMKFSGNQTLNSLMKQIEDTILNNRNFSSYSKERKAQINSEHKNIITAMKLKDRDKAAKFMREHITNGYKYIELIRKKREES